MARCSTFEAGISCTNLKLSSGELCVHHQEQKEAQAFEHFKAEKEMADDGVLYYYLNDRFLRRWLAIKYHAVMIDIEFAAQQ